MSQLTNKEMLQFIHDRMIHVHGENENVDYMHGMRRVMEALEAAEADAEDAHANYQDIACRVVPENEALKARVVELEELPRRAYGEGYADAVTHVPNSVEDMRASWKVSSVRKALNTGGKDG